MLASRLTMMALAPAAIVGAAAVTAFLIASRCCCAKPANADGSGSDSGGAGGSKPEKEQSEPPPQNYVRPAGPEEMKNPPSDGWSDVDEASDESFPASDPPAKY
tara:strand:- start:1374 stop:1685 length:312 start_codon:yes stop_codon:yes gene_type:complete